MYPEVRTLDSLECAFGALSSGTARILRQEVDRIRVDIFDVAHLIIGGGAEGDKTTVRTREEADHSLPYILAVAALDRKVREFASMLG